MTTGQDARAPGPSAASGPSAEAAAVRRFSGRVLLALLATLILAGPFLLVLLLVLSRWRALADLDTAAVDAAHTLALAQPGLTESMALVSTVLHPWVLRVVAAAVALGLLVVRRRRVGLWALTAALGSGLIDMGVKSAVARARPHLPDPVSHAPGYSFPSGHALGSLVCLVVVAACLSAPASAPLRRVLWSLAGLGVAAVGFSRVELGAHYPSDVVAGWLLGAAWLAASGAAFDVWRRPSLAAWPEDRGRA